MIKVAALTSGKRAPSSRFRVRQHIAPLQEMGIDVREYVSPIDKYSVLPGWPRSIRPWYGFPVTFPWELLKLSTRLPGVCGTWKCGVTWLERLLLPGAPTLESLLRHPLLFDVDDAIWLYTPFGKQGAARVARRADIVVAGNNFLADWFSTYSRNVRVLPTAVDTDQFSPSPGEKTHTEHFVIGWIGTSSNLPYLESIESALRRFLDDHERAVLTVIADRPPRLKSMGPERIHFLPWSEATEVEAIRRLDVGLMPLPDNESTRGKCSFKMLQYMACGIPVVVSPVGMNNEIFSLGNPGFLAAENESWYESLSALYRDNSSARRFGDAGRTIVMAHYSRKIISKKLAEIVFALAQ